MYWLYRHWYSVIINGKAVSISGGITGDLAGYFLSLCELAQLLSLVVLSLGMENWK